IKRRAHNRAVKGDVKAQIKRVLNAAAEGVPAEELRKELNLAAKKLDKAAAKRVVHPNLAARKKSQLARLVHAKTTAATKGWCGLVGCGSLRPGLCCRAGGIRTLPAGPPRSPQLFTPAPGAVRRPVVQSPFPPPRALPAGWQAGVRPNT